MNKIQVQLNEFASGTPADMDLDDLRRQMDPNLDDAFLDSDQFIKIVVRWTEKRSNTPPSTPLTSWASSPAKLDHLSRTQEKVNQLQEDIYSLKKVIDRLKEEKTDLVVANEKKEDELERIKAELKVTETHTPGYRPLN